MTPDDLQREIADTISDWFSEDARHFSGLTDAVMAVVAPALTALWEQADQLEQWGSRERERAEAAERGRDEWAAIAKGYVDVIQERDRLIHEARAALDAAQAENERLRERGQHAAAERESYMPYLRRALAQARAERDALRAAVERVRVLCDEAEKDADTYKGACIVTTGKVRAALDGEPE